jgi:hypothetical protein
MEWASRIINDFEKNAPPKSSAKAKKNQQPTSEDLGDMMDRCCLHVYLMGNDVSCLRVAKQLTGSKLDKYNQMWEKG